MTHYKNEIKIYQKVSIYAKRNLQKSPREFELNTPPNGIRFSNNPYANAQGNLYLISKGFHAIFVCTPNNLYHKQNFLFLLN